ncbi:hypothetical protein RHMOL_Rhmol07G0275800 [Rhododendron molle]|uniref:Uncharacterized protein n=1 Tax=Rhododendron molle TaxID=49168 RepID=A0ACC0N6H8_RHOML|nr:hypothetical protein RHMOL_Rhmol07G0275800 [Rhododendron molle]
MRPAAREASGTKEGEGERDRVNQGAVPKPKKRVIKPGDKFRFSFDWENTEDTSRDINFLYQNPHEARLLFGRGFRAGVDRCEQKKLAAKNDRDLREEIRKKDGAEERPKEEAMARRLADEATDLYDTFDMRVDRHWSDKNLEEMTERDWRIFSISYEGSRIPRPMRSWAESRAFQGCGRRGWVQEAFPHSNGGYPIGVATKGCHWRCRNWFGQGCEVVIATPGRLIDCLERRYAVLNQCNYAVLDEADLMIDMGFEPQVVGVLDAMPSSNFKPENEGEELDEKKIYRTTCMFSATMPPAVEQLARKYLRNPVVVTIGTAGKATDLITQHVIMVKHTEKLFKLQKLLDELGDKTAIVFINTKKNADSLAKSLDKAGYHVTTLHGGKSQEQREISLKRFQGEEIQCTITMASSNSSNYVQISNVHHFELGDGMRLQVSVTGFSNGSNAKVELQLKNCSRTWILHWGCIYHGNKNWFIPADHPPGTIYKQMALQTPFTKSGDMYVIIIQLRDPRTDAIEFVLKDSRNDTWLKLNQGNFQIKIPKTDSSTSQPPIPKDLIDRRAYLRWESRGRPVSSPQQQKQDHDIALRELQSLSAKGISLDELQNSRQIAGTNRPVLSREHLSSQKPYSCRRRHDIEQWTNKYTKGNTKNTNLPSSALLDRVEKSIGGDDVILQQTYNVGSYEIVVLLKIVGGDYHITVAGNTKGATVLHWGVSKSSLGEWLIQLLILMQAPPMDIMPENSKPLDAACQTYFMDISNGKGFFQFVDINLQQRRFLGIQFIIWSGGSWIKNNGANFCVGLNSITSGKVEGGGGGIVKWLLDEISHREKEAERSLMHRFNIATELTERCKNEGELGLIGMLVWLRFMACRQLTWNKNYNVKPREISEAQERFTNLLQRIYLDQPNVREILRLIMLCIGRGGQGDVGQRIRDEILVLQRNNDCKGGMMEEWHQKLHNNSSPDDVIICEALLNYVRSGFKIDVYWQTLNANGLTKDILASYDRPIVSEPHFRTDAQEGLLRDLTSYLKTLKAVHSGADLESAIETCLGFVPKDSLYFVKAHIGDKNIAPLIEKLVESRIELRPVLLTAHGRSKDLLFLDLALDSAVRTTVEMGLKDLNSASLPEIMYFIALVLENLCLSTFNNEELIYCTKDWYRVSESCKPNDGQWALQTKAVLDRVGLVLANRSQYYHQMIQPSVQYLGRLLSLDKGAIDIFTEELIRAGSAASLSMLINHLDPILRKVANLGSWQVISPMDVTGLVVSVNELISVQTKVYRKPTVIIANKVSGEEEIPNGAVAVLTADTPDVLSHVSIRARNNKA